MNGWSGFFPITLQFCQQIWVKRKLIGSMAKERKQKLLTGTGILNIVHLLVQYYWLAYNVPFILRALVNFIELFLIAGDEHHIYF